MTLAPIVDFKRYNDTLLRRLGLAAVQNCHVKTAEERLAIAE